MRSIEWIICWQR